MNNRRKQLIRKLKMKRARFILAVIMGAVVLFACLGLLGYFGVRMMRRANLRLEAREAFDAKDWKKAEKLLRDYTRLDQDSEEDFVRLAQVYRHFGNTDEEMHCWYRASLLNPLREDYWDDYTRCAMNARYFPHLYTTLSQRVYADEELAPREKKLYLICAVMTDRIKEAERYYDVVLEESPEIFEEDDLGRYAEFLVTFRERKPDERLVFFEMGMKSDDPIVRLESILFHLVEVELSDQEVDAIREQKEALLNKAYALNRFAVTPYLADFYFSQLRFASVIELAGPYLEDIVHVPLALLYAESCVYAGQPEKLPPLAERFRALERKYRPLVSYFEALYDFCQGGERFEELVRHMQEMGGIVQTALSCLINLQIALNSDNMETIFGSLDIIMKSAPFYDIQDRARSSAAHYLWTKIEENPALADDPGRMIVKIAQLIVKPGESDPFLMRILVSDMARRDVLNRQIIQEYLADYPVDPFLLQVAAEYELFNGNPEQCVEYTERFFALQSGQNATAFAFLHMLAMEVMGKIDEAAQEYTALVEKSEMDRGILYRYFKFCIKHERAAELSLMADRLDDSDVPDLKALAPFFRAEVLLLKGRRDEALSLLETARTEHPDFALHAANLFCTCDMLDQALAGYLALVGKHPDQRLILANIAEVYMAKGMKGEALTYSKQAWETSPDDEIAQLVYAKMLAADGRYQDAERILKMPYRQVELPPEIKETWTDIMVHCIREDLENRLYWRAFERSNHYLLFFPDDATFLAFKARVEQELRQTPDMIEPDEETAQPPEAGIQPRL